MKPVENVEGERCRGEQAKRHASALCRNKRVAPCAR